MAQINSNRLLNEFFGVFQAYSKIIESCLIFGKCPLTWNREKARVILDRRIFVYYGFWGKTVLIFITFVSPLYLTVLRYALNWVTYPKIFFNDNVPFVIICTYIFAIPLVLGMLLIYIPLLLWWEKCVFLN